METGSVRGRASRERRYAGRAAACRRIPLLIIVAVLVLGGSRALAEQPAVDIGTITRPPQTGAPLVRRDDTSPPHLTDRPVFVGPTVRTANGEFGLSLWAAPSLMVGHGRSVSNDSGGWLVLGITVTWGDPPDRRTRTTMRAIPVDEGASAR